MLRSGYLTKGYYLLTILGTLVTLFYYFQDQSAKPEDQLHMALDELKNSDRLVQQDGFRHLKSLYTTKRFFSGPIKFGIDFKTLMSSSVVDTLVSNISSDYPEIAHLSLLWLSKLIKHSHDEGPNARFLDRMAVLGWVPQHYGGQPPNKQHDVRERIRAADPGFTNLCRAIDTFGKSAAQENWYLAARILLTYSCSQRDQEIDLDRGLISSAVNKLLASQDPTALLVGARLYGTFYNKIDLTEEARAGMTAVQRSASHVQMSEPRSLEVPWLDPLPPWGDEKAGASWASIVGFSVLGALWGKLVWPLALYTSPEYFRAMRGEDRATVKQWSKKFLLKRRVGTAVALIMLFDYSATNFLRSKRMDPYRYNWEGTNPSYYNIGFPSLVIIGTGAATMYAIKYHRYVILPLVLACLYNNRDLIPVKNRGPQLMLERALPWSQELNSKFHDNVESLSQSIGGSKK